MSKADWTYLKTSQHILKCGLWDTQWDTKGIRPKWSDGTPAYSTKVFAVSNRYNLKDEFPITALRLTNWKGAIDEILWIWQKKSNNINDLHSHIWDQWADEKGSIGKAYGYQVGKKAKYREGEFDQTDRVLYSLKNNPADRAIITELFNIEQLHDMHLRPCVHHMQFDVANDTLNMFLKQRSNDTLAAGNWNVVQYAALLKMLAQVSGLKPGIMEHVIVNSHIYDRHVPFFIELTVGRMKQVQTRLNEFNTNRTAMQNYYINKLLSPEIVETHRYNKVMEAIDKLTVLFDKKIDFDAMIEQAQYFQQNPTDYFALCQKFVNSKAFQLADDVTSLMLECPDLEKALGFSSPELHLDENVKDFYDFKSPKMKDENGKFADNPQSSFSVSNYHPETEGIKFKVKVPVAE